MKKLILITMMASICLTAISQTKKDVAPSEVKKDVPQVKDSLIQKGPSDTLLVDISKVRYLKFKDAPVAYDLATQIPLFVTYKWIIDSYIFFKDAKSGLSVSDIEQNYLPPLNPFWEDYLRQLKEQQAKQPNKGKQ